MHICTYISHICHIYVRSVWVVASTEQVCLISLRSCPLVRLSVDLIRILASCELKPLLSNLVITHSLPLRAPSASCPTSLPNRGFGDGLGQPWPYDIPQTRRRVGCGTIVQLSCTCHTPHPSCIVPLLSVPFHNTTCIGGAAVRRRTRDRKVSGSTPGRGAIKSTRSTQPSIPPG